MRKLPKQFAYLEKEAGPRILVEALRWHGVEETPGPVSNPAILAWAAFVGADSYYKSDATPWCALWLAFVVKIAGFAPPRDPLRALSWLSWGTPVRDGACLGDVLVMSRAGGGHVSIYVGETQTHYWGLGANQNDSVCIAAFPKGRIAAIRRCPWKVSQPANVRRILVGPGVLATGPAKES